MPIGRITGPMLVKNLERQGIDLAVEGNLIYWDVTRRFVGVRTDTPGYVLDVRGNAFIGNTLTIGSNNQALYRLPVTTAPNTGSILISSVVGARPHETIWSNVLIVDQVNRRIGIDKQPEYKLDIAGNLNVETSANIGSNLFVGNTIFVSNQYSLPTSTPNRGDVIVALGGENSKTIWYPGPPEPNFTRRRYCKVIDNLLGYGKVEFTMKLGQAAIVYNLSVSRPVKVEVFGTPEKNEPNPYTFIATPDHLTDDGSVWLNDGSSYQSRQYSIFTNLEEPPKDIHYVTVTSIDNHLANTPVVLELLYYPPLLDSQYEENKPVKFGTTLPAANISTDGDLFYNVIQSKLYIHYSGNWAAI